MIFKRFFKPYAEYCLRTTLSEDELKNALDKEFSEYDFISGISLSVFSNDDKVYFFKTARPLTLSPGLRGRNLLRGDVHIQCRKAEPGKETVLDITIAPKDKRLYLLLYGCLLAVVILVAANLWWWFGIVFALLGIGFLFLNLSASRSFADSEVPEIERAFENTLRQLEKKYKDNNQGRGDHE